MATWLMPYIGFDWAQALVLIVPAFMAFCGWLATMKLIAMIFEIEDWPYGKS
ncbi:MAG: hypothetical protein HY243_15515 [Proteobacteria bacterium]|nr:hypothetical protein [Pseudomonadota bacterium]